MRILNHFNIGNLTEHRLAHINAVAKFMYEKADGDESYKQDMFTLGLLHDIGYISGESKGHSRYGGLILKRNHYKYWQEVYYHGQVEAIDSYISYELDLLNSADLQINSKGEYIGIEKRLDDIKNRYGEDSSQYKNSLVIINDLISRNRLVV